MTINLQEADICALREVFAARKIPDLEVRSEDIKFEFNLSLYQLEEE